MWYKNVKTASFHGDAMFEKRRQSARLRKNLRKFSKKRVDVSKYVKDFYVENGLAYISCNVKGYYDIIDPYSVAGYEWLNDSFARFIETNAMYVPTEYPIVLEICGTSFSQEQKDVIEATIADYYALKLGDCQLVLEQNAKKSITLLVMGILFAILIMKWGSVLDANAALSEASFIFYWLFLWEFVDYAWFERRDLISDRVDAAQMASIKVVYKPVFVDSPVADEETVLDEIFETIEILPSDYDEDDEEDITEKEQ